jgi:RTX calcium-binding nonapeptide repeat (4 copies)
MKMSRAWIAALTACVAVAAVSTAVVPDAGAATISFANQRDVRINGVGTATPYPSTIRLAGLGGTVTNVRASLVRIKHDFPSDIDAVLAGPAGTDTMLMSDACAANVFVQATFTFDDEAPELLASDSCDSLADTFKPTNHAPEPPGGMPPPATPWPWSNELSPLTGTSPNGSWRLFVVDDEELEAGRLLDGWRITLSGVESNVRCFGRIPRLLGTARGEPLGFGRFDPLSADGAGDRVIAGLGNGDRVLGGDKADRLCGGAGNDDLRGGRGNDMLEGGPGRDLLVGGPGQRDRCHGGSGKDRLRDCERGKSGGRV